MTVVKINGDLIGDWDSFHDVFADALGFPDFYGRNMSAWVDCMTYVDDADAGMTKVAVPPGSVLTLQIENVNSFAQRCPELYSALIECAAFVNWRRIELGQGSVLTLSFHKTEAISS
jgi:RNAse (barnase) inhibitor barstar